MKIGILYSGGKDSNYAAIIAKRYGHEITCLITIESENKESYMFQTPSITQTKKQAEAMGIPIVTVKTKGVKEEELVDLNKAIKTAIKKYEIEGVATGAIESVYQASRIQKICEKRKIWCFNPLWQKNQEELLEEIIKEKIEAIIVGVSAEGLNKDWLGRKIDKKMIEEIKILNKKSGINHAFEGGEAETLVLQSPLFKKKLEVKDKKILGEGNNWRMEAELE
ncbi:MAG: diphthine--ammonia ligase [Nanoarchaeota archaeon]